MVSSVSGNAGAGVSGGSHLTLVWDFTLKGVCVCVCVCVCGCVVVGCENHNCETKTQNYGMVQVAHLSIFISSPLPERACSTLYTQKQKSCCD